MSKYKNVKSKINTFNDLDKVRKQKPMLDCSDSPQFEIKPNIVVNSVGRTNTFTSLTEVVELVNAADNDQPIIGLLFKQVILAIETKLTEMQDRLDNRDQLQELNTHLTQLQSLSPVNFKEEDKSMIRHKSQALLQPQAQQDQPSLTSSYDNFGYSPERRSAKHNTMQPPRDPSIKASPKEFNRLDVFEKKIKSLEDKLAKQYKEIAEMNTVHMGRVEKQIKSYSERKDTSKQYNDTFAKQIEDINENHKSLIGYLHQQQSELSDVNINLTKTKEEILNKQMAVDAELELRAREQRESVQQIQQVQQIMTSVESDLLSILKSYKDILNELFRIDILQNQVKKMQMLWESG